MELWLNPSCSKCRTAASALDEAGVDYTVRRYLDDPPSAEELRDVVARIGVEPWDVARPKESREAGIDLPRDAEHRSDWYAALASNPRAIQRPIVVADDGSAMVAREPEALDRAIRSARQPGV